MRPALAAVSLLIALVVTLPAQQPTAPARRPALPEGVTLLKDQAYLPDNLPRHRLDLYLPKEGEGLRPLVIWVHGGGWQNGSKESTPALGLLKAGFAVASVNYRLTDAACYPAQIEDCKAAVRWLRANAKTHRLDPERFGAWGASAGGHLVALLGAAGDVKELEGKEGHLDQSSRVQAVCAWFGAYDFTVMAGPQVENPLGAVHKLLGGPLKDKQELAKLASPVRFASKDDPPFLLMHGDKDLLVPLRQSQLLEEALKKEGVACDLVVVEGVGHIHLGEENVKKVEAFFTAKLKK